MTLIIVAEQRTSEAPEFRSQPSADLAREIIRMRLEADILDSEALARHLASGGFGALLGEIDRAALKSGAPFLESDTPPAVARSQWSHAFDVIVREAALNEAIESAKGDFADLASIEMVKRMKTQRDVLRRAIGAKAVWADGMSHD